MLIQGNTLRLPPPLPEPKLVTLLDAAAAVEAELQNVLQENAELRQRLLVAESKVSRLGRWIAAIRRGHRRASHNKTTLLFKEVVRQESL